MCEFVETKDVNDEHIAYLARCCGDVKTDSWITLSVHLSDSEHDTALTAHTARIASTHERKLARLTQAASIAKAK